MADEFQNPGWGFAGEFRCICRPSRKRRQERDQETQDACRSDCDTPFLLDCIRSAGRPTRSGRPTQTAPTPKTKVAIINLQYVVKSYDRWKQFEDEYKRNYKGYDEQFEQIKKQGLELKARLEKMRADDPEGDNIKRQLKDLDRKVQVWGMTQKAAFLQLARQYVGPDLCPGRRSRERLRQGQRSSTLFWCCNNGVRAPSCTMHEHSVQNANRALMPIYSVNGTDISNYIIYMLNAHYKAASTAVGSPNGGQPRQQ